MLFEIDREFLKENVLPKFGEDSYVAEVLEEVSRFSPSKVFVDPARLTVEELDDLYNIAKEHKNKSLMSSISAVRSMLRNLTDAKITSLPALETALIAYIKTDAIDGWLYSIDKDGIIHPYLVTNIKYHPGSSRDDNPQVIVSLQANSPRSDRGIYKASIHIDSGDTNGVTIPQLLEKQGYFHETEELKNMYTEHVSLFSEYQPQFGKQFWVEGPVYTSFGYYRDKISTKQAKAVNDEEVLERSFVPLADPNFWRKTGVTEGFEKIPFHSFIYFFHLDIHRNIWVHSSQLRPYEYDPSLKEKLVLPDTHRDLIDILVQDMDILADDIIEGKSGGTTILCEGASGLGKTLSAEVYSEVTEKPLYRVHSGQLGLSMQKVEERLEEILKRAARWGAILLIDEADVYIRQRGNDLEHNAVVASFLRTLEYFDGLLFLTTNRGQDVDDAILSRCVAVIKYEKPDAVSAKKLWNVLSTQFGVYLDDNLITELVNAYPEASGRDIKQLIKLSAKYAYGKKTDLTLDVFKSCAQFRGM